MRQEMQTLRDSMSQGKNLAQAQSEIERFGADLQLPADVLRAVEGQVSDLVRNGWTPKDAIEYVGRPIQAFAKARAPAPPPAAAPKPGPKVLTESERRAMSVSSLQGRGAGKPQSNNPRQVLENARRLAYGGRN
jgi:hypothetical protein